MREAAIPVYANFSGVMILKLKIVILSTFVSDSHGAYFSWKMSNNYVNKHNDKAPKQ